MAEHILIAYFTSSGNTRKIANQIHGVVGGTIYEIHPEVPYNEYNAVLEQAKRNSGRLQTGAEIENG